MLHFRGPLIKLRGYITVVHLHLITDEDVIERYAVTVTQVDTSVKSNLFI
jgi:hypothetical protein